MAKFILKYFGIIILFLVVTVAADVVIGRLLFETKSLPDGGFIFQGLTHINTFLLFLPVFWILFQKDFFDRIRKSLLEKISMAVYVVLTLSILFYDSYNASQEWLRISADGMEWYSKGGLFEEDNHEKVEWSQVTYFSSNFLEGISFNYIDNDGTSQGVSFEVLSPHDYDKIEATAKQFAGTR